MKNSFKINSYTGYYELSCSKCINFSGPDKWPAKNREARCRHHKISLAFLINEHGYLIHEEWFCKDIVYKNMPSFHREELDRK
jgi:hypothetical protein